MKQQFLEVWREGTYWYEFPIENEDNTRMYLMKAGLDRICEIRPKTAPVKIERTHVFLDLTDHANPGPPAPTPAAPIKRVRTRKPTPAKGTHNDIS